MLYALHKHRLALACFKEQLTLQAGFSAGLGLFGACFGVLFF